MKLKRSTRINIVVALFLLFVFLMHVRIVGKVIKYWPNLGRDVESYDRRFDELKKELPPHGIVGYVSDNVVRDGIHATQYALTPLIVAGDTERALVVGNFHGPAGQTELVKDPNLVLIKDFGNGVRLYKREAE